MNRLKWRIKGILSFLRFQKDLRAAMCLAQSNWQLSSSHPICFIAGCGRSGTTLLGQLLAKHPDITYFNEPRSYWMAIASRTDIWGYCPQLPSPDTLLMPSPSEDEIIRFHALFGKVGQASRFLLEKTPENIFRLPWLLGLSPQAKLIHIVRNGYDVIRSIQKESSFDIPYGLKDMNNWYGAESRKRRLLARSAQSVGINSVIVESCITSCDWAALEWICSLQAFSRNKQLFAAANVFELRYEDLTEATWENYNNLLSFLDLPCPVGLQKEIISFVRSRQKPSASPVLSPRIRELFETESIAHKYPTP